VSDDEGKPLEDLPPLFSAGTTWWIFGLLFFIGGMIVIGVAFGMRVSVSMPPLPTSSYATELDSREIVNTGLLQKQMMVMVAGSVTTLVGAAFMAAGGIVGAVGRRASVGGEGA
jgi:hypothetical protein